jgi:D-alanyl-D-alanine carboxypeptidase (penicillin-binding protein 5/6)
MSMPSVFGKVLAQSAASRSLLPAALLAGVALMAAARGAEPPQAALRQSPPASSGKAAILDSGQAKPDLKQGDQGPAVEDLQRRLNARLDPSPALSIDGDFGPATRAALIRFQRANELEPTGVADAKSQQALGNAAIAESDVPPPSVVNTQRTEKRPPDPLDGPPFVTARAWAITAGGTGQVLWSSDASKPLEIASTTKIMTALLVLRQVQKNPALLDEVVTFSERADKTPGSTSGIRAGESLPVRELLFGLLLPSGNDAATALAEHFGGRFPAAGENSAGGDPLPRFVAEMNRQAAELKLAETHFANPHGLPAADHHSSARDLAKLAALALRDPIIAACVATTRHGYTLSDSAGHKRNVVWENTNRLLATQGYDGIKTGSTSGAGSCLIASGRRGGDHLIVVVLGSTSSDARYVDARNLFRWAWQKRGARNQGTND